MEFLTPSSSSSCSLHNLNFSPKLHRNWCESLPTICVWVEEWRISFDPLILKTFLRHSYPHHHHPSLHFILKYVVFRIWITGIDMEKMEIPLNDTIIFSLSNFAFLRWWIVSSLEAFEAFSLFCFSTNDYICSKFQPFNIVLSKLLYFALTRPFIFIHSPHHSMWFMVEKWRRKWNNSLSRECVSHKQHNTMDCEK